MLYSYKCSYLGDAHGGRDIDNTPCVLGWHVPKVLFNNANTTAVLLFNKYCCTWCQSVYMRRSSTVVNEKGRGMSVAFALRCPLPGSVSCSGELNPLSQHRVAANNCWAIAWHQLGSYILGHDLSVKKDDGNKDKDPRCFDHEQRTRCSAVTKTMPLSMR